MQFFWPQLCTVRLDGRIHLTRTGHRLYAFLGEEEQHFEDFFYLTVLCKMAFNQQMAPRTEAWRKARWPEISPVGRLNREAENILFGIAPDGSSIQSVGEFNAALSEVAGKMSKTLDETVYPPTPMTARESIFREWEMIPDESCTPEITEEYHKRFLAAPED